MFVHTLPVGVFQCNCGIVVCAATGKAVVVDPGDAPDRILRVVRDRRLDVILVAFTHAHIDHLMGAFEVVRATGANARIHARDQRLWDRLDLVATSLGIPTPSLPALSVPLADGELISFGQARMRVIYTPGHTPGSCCFAFAEDEGSDILFSGDTLFHGTVGNVDLHRKPGLSTANAHTIVTSIRERLLTLPDATRVIPGHGAETTIGYERRHNRFLQEQAPVHWGA